MRVLGLDTATWTATVGVIDGERTLAERSRVVSGSHAVTLLPLVEETLSAGGMGLGDVDLIAVSIGPGSFTGVRIALSVAKGLAMAARRPLVGVPTLAALAEAAGGGGVVWPVLDARKGELYAAAFARHEHGLAVIRPPMTLSPARLLEALAPPCRLVGEGAALVAEDVRARWGAAIGLDPAVAPRGTVIARLGAARYRTQGADDIAVLEPTYVRPSEAELGRRTAEP
jgi:tRNA threonylcarbamoyladenosine biosynthesis protein TsaB